MVFTIVAMHSQLFALQVLINLNAATDLPIPIQFCFRQQLRACFIPPRPHSLPPLALIPILLFRWSRLTLRIRFHHPQ